jgi:hypothetical protein
VFFWREGFIGCVEVIFPKLILLGDFQNNTWLIAAITCFLVLVISKRNFGRWFSKQYFYGWLLLSLVLHTSRGTLTSQVQSTITTPWHKMENVLRITITQLLYKILWWWEKNKENHHHNSTTTHFKPQFVKKKHTKNPWTAKKNCEVDSDNKMYSRVTTINHYKLQFWNNKNKHFAITITKLLDKFQMHISSPLLIRAYSPQTTSTRNILQSPSQTTRQVSNTHCTTTRAITNHNSPSQTTNNKYENMQSPSQTPR